MRKLCSKWVLRLLTINQKQQRVDDLDKKGFLRKYMTIDETWNHHFTPESNQQSAVWTAASESRSKRPKTQTSVGKFLASVFWDAQGVLFMDYLKKGITINSEYHTALFVRLKKEIVKKR